MILPDANLGWFSYPNRSKRFEDVRGCGEYGLQYEPDQMGYPLLEFT